MNYSKPMPTASSEYESNASSHDADAFVQVPRLWRLVVGIVLLIVSLLLVSLAILLDLDSDEQTLPSPIHYSMIEAPANVQLISSDCSASTMQQAAKHSNPA